MSKYGTEYFEVTIEEIRPAGTSANHIITFTSINFAEREWKYTTVSGFNRSMLSVGDTITVVIYDGTICMYVRKH